MKKFKKISIVFLAVLLLVVFYLIITTEEVNDQMLLNIGNEDVVENINSESIIDLSQDDYKQEVSRYFSEYIKIQERDNITKNNLLEIEDKLLALKVPTEFKDLHINFILAISKMRQYLEDDDENKKKESENIITEIKLNNNWIGNI